MISTNLGFPRIGGNRELKTAMESYWQGNASADVLNNVARMLRARHWQWQSQAGIDHIPSNDFSLYDHVLDTVVMVGAIPARYGWQGGVVNLDMYFSMARGNDIAPAMEMTKWFDTNYHYIVPEFEPGTRFTLSSMKIVEEFKEALTLGILTRPVLLGPVSFLKLGRWRGDLQPQDLMDKLLPVYQEILERLALAGAEWVQIDEPVLALDMNVSEIQMTQHAYKRLSTARRPKVCLAAYFGSIADKLSWAPQLAVDAMHVDLVRAPDQLDTALEYISGDMYLSLGVINGRNVWKTDLIATLESIQPAIRKLGPEHIMIAPSCSLLHCPVDVNQESALPENIHSKLAFAKQKLDEIKALSQAAYDSRAKVATTLKDKEPVCETTCCISRENDSGTRQRLAALTPEFFSRTLSYAQRRHFQQTRLNLPLLPTTTIGSFPQTRLIRKARAKLKSGVLAKTDYQIMIRNEIEKVVRFQEEIGLDVLVHGEPERNDMVEYFAEMLDGFIFTQNGWVQSYGSRCVKPPVIFSDVRRRYPMTVDWIAYAQSLTSRPVKGMLTGPLTILQWSFEREDQPRSNTAFQIAMAIRDEIADLEAVGIGVIQIDEPALREGMPLRQEDWPSYFDWAIKAFRLATSGVKDETQIHTHMCYSDFNEIMEYIAALDADVISIEASRSDLVLLKAFTAFEYPNEIGPGVYDIHSFRVPSEDEIQDKIEQMLRLLQPAQLWINPDCGLKTRAWPEVRTALSNMVSAAKVVRKKISGLTSGGNQPEAG